MATEIYMLLFGFSLPLICFLCICVSRKNHNPENEKSSWIKDANQLYQEKEREYLKRNKRKISPEAAKIYNEQLAIYKQNMKKDCTAGLTAKWFEEAIENCDMQKATMFCKDLWERHDAKLLLNEYIMTNLFKIHDYYE